MTFKVMFTLRLRTPLVPVTVIVWSPSGAVTLACTVSREIAELFDGGITCDGLRTARTLFMDLDVTAKSTG